ncbi:putative secreted protein [Pseudonocardia sp. Ae168_Ps1]|uniref:C40 family peptidase n=1 Tax=unclassified Pseudonocardia TaxID=2619320 RepID=UPI00094AB8C2|nr:MULTISPECIES: NlpC/P60 family protein [unclassified Pseudonocardia]OLL74999.1 putative secreted protein [Pseudonocardia sp. Ae150A_Ps1]OLL80992.1 putative secreted protein [Pseudonocardia sp. Ae168_Ps1]OLL84892.1 putative secreted protein [Pseudonocardia sp. Ae263_Ps1]OLL95091.1 putative secreted protein [Pseudonocardia sp. Ae356_Ps1]
MPQRTTAPALRVAVVATAAAAAALSVLPAAAAAPADAAPAPAASVTRDVAPAAAVLPAAPAPAVNPAAQNVAEAAKAAAPAARAAAARSSALSTAMAQLGKPYSWGATGPSAFDCSGLVSYAYKKAGKDVPRTSKAQASAGTKVSKSNLQAGDLVFFYSPVSHVGIYMGDGKIVHASTSGEPVKVSDMDAMPFNSARRI